MNMVVMVGVVVVCLGGMAPPVQGGAATRRGGATVARPNRIETVTSEADFTGDGHHAWVSGRGN